MEIVIPVAGRASAAALRRPPRARGLVVLAHGMGLDHRDARDRQLAAALNHAGLATLQPELLDPFERRERHDAVDIELQGGRLLEVLVWLDAADWARSLPLGLFGGGLGAAVALLAAARRPGRIGAVVCRGGRPDGALFRLAQVAAPTLLIAEHEGWPYRSAYEALRAPKGIVVVPSASGRFDEPAAAQAVAAGARHWFLRHLQGAGALRERAQPARG